MAKKKTRSTKAPQRTPAQEQKARESKAARRAEEKARRKREKRNKILRITAISVGSVAAVTGIAVAVHQLVQNSGILMQTRVAASTKNFELTNAQYCYFYDQCYDSYVSYFSEEGRKLEFDVNKKLRDQKTPDGDTWHEFFLENTNAVVQTTLQYCELAYKEGFTLTEEQLKTCADNAAKMDMAGMPKGVTREDMQKAMEIELLGNSYYSQYVNAIEVTDEEIDAQYEKNKAKYQMWDVLCYTIAWSADANASNTALTKEQAGQYAKELSECKSVEEFEAYVRNFLIKVKLKTEADADNMVKAMKISTNGASYQAAVADWAMNKSPELYDTFITTEEGQTSYQVYMLTSMPRRNESDTVDFRVIVLPYGSYTDKEGALEKAEMLMDQWEKDGADEDAFYDLALSYTADSSTYQNGGLVKAYSADRTTYGKDIAKWLFADGRKKGDTTILAADDAGTGVVLMAYYLEDNPRNVWENQAYDDVYKAEMAVLTDAQKLVLVSMDQENQLKLDF